MGMPIFRTDGVDLYYETHGDAGEPVVFVHGYTGDVADWRHQVTEFSRTHRLLTFDLRGHGRSSAPADAAAYAIERLADDVEALAAHAGFDRSHLVGHSMGGAAAQEVALRSPDRLLSLTLHDTSPRFGTSRPPASASWYAERLRVAREDGMAAVAAMQSPSPPPPHRTAERQAYERQRLASMSVDGFVGAWQALGDWPGTRDRVAAIRVPTLVIYGELEPESMVSASRFLAEAIPGAELVCVPEAGHAPQDERPELFNAALRRHLERNVGAAAR
jgi:3-oxoadipate enol-lactonase